MDPCERLGNPSNMTHTEKTNRSFLKRVKITGRGKIMKRPRQDYFNATKNSGDRTRQKRGRITAPGSLTRSAKALLQSNY